MKILLNILVFLLLLFNATGALYGGWSLMMHPDGSGLGMSLIYLDHTSFSSYFLPGFILFCCNGLLSLAVLGLLLFNKPYYPWFVIAQGAILSGWIIIQVLLLRHVVSLHIIMGTTGLFLVLCGVRLLRIRKPE
ncbi:MAG: hypothetical protein JST26_00405 [Bacteroidetes bacterium]|nr:hypothetical protein [Bacteroidota bacterium]